MKKIHKNLMLYSILIFFVFLPFNEAYSGWFSKFKAKFKRSIKKIKKELKQAKLKVKKSLANSSALREFALKKIAKSLGVSEKQFWAALSAKAGDTLNSRYGLYKNQQVVSYVNNIGKNLLKHVDKKLECKFAVLNTDMVNAFALPTGQIYVTKGLLNTVETEDELAFVIGHEIGHVRNEDGQKALIKSLASTLALRLLLGKKAKKYKWLFIVQNFIMLRFSRKDEFEADRAGLHYAAKAGYDPYGAIGFFTKLKSKEKTTSGLARTILKFTSTHPLTEDRIRKARALARELKGIK